MDHKNPFFPVERLSDLTHLSKLTRHSEEEKYLLHNLGWGIYRWQPFLGGLFKKHRKGDNAHDLDDMD